MSLPLNYNHLYYFWVSAKHRNVTRAARELGLAQPTVSAQIHSLEQSLGMALLARRGRTFELTRAGQIVFQQADEMFAISSGLRNALAGRYGDAPQEVRVGTSDAVPKPIVRRLLEPLLTGEDSFRLVCREWRIGELLSELSAHRLDMVISDRPHPESSQMRAVSHAVGETAVAVFARPALSRRLRKGYPHSLHGAPMFLPAAPAALRESLDQWLTANSIVPRVIGEFEDRELLKTFGRSGLAAFPAVGAIEKDVTQQFEVERVGWARGVRETYYAIALQRHLKHPAVAMILSAPRQKLQVGASAI
ncbi:MAG: LysR family transcriptional regulator [Phycisphaerales bacterium]|nr:LysR family transcriptional regulator [Phycisphaerales bacterium]MCI0676068.1 LysR family transcriptional regulator [Phycisphaerales bacterium]